MYPYEGGDEDLDYVEHKLLVAINRSQDCDEQYELSVELTNYQRMFKR